MSELLPRGPGLEARLLPAALHHPVSFIALTGKFAPKCCEPLWGGVSLTAWAEPPASLPLESADQ